MANYLYNGVELPDINEVWTDELKAQYPYALINVMSNNPTTTLFLVKNISYGHSDGLGRVLILGTDNACQARSTSPHTKWGPIDNTVALSVAVESIEWANFDVLNEDGSVLLSASDPVPVGGEPEEPETVLAWQKHDAYKPNTEWDGHTFYKIIGNKWVKHDAYNPQGGTS